MYKMKTSVALLCYLLISLSEQSVDLNLRQLQFVADHLTPTECDKLSLALTEDGVQVLPWKPSGPITHEKPCLIMLTDWSRGKGANQTVDELALRLHEIGRPDVAQSLSKAVYDETNFQLHRYFLDDPFRKSAHESSVLLEDDDVSEEEKDKSRHLVIGGQYVSSGQRVFLYAVVASTLTLILVVIVIGAVYVPSFTETVCPSCFVNICSVLKDRWKDQTKVWRKVLGLAPLRQPAHRQPGDLSQEERERLLRELMSGLPGV